MKRRICISLCIFVFTVAAMFFVFQMSARAAEVITSGNCGRNATWILDDAGTLTISGTGNMNHYPTATKVPWSSYVDQIQAVVIEDGITGVGNYAFSNCSKLTYVRLPAGLQELGDEAFAYCQKLRTIELPSGLRFIGRGAFQFCKGLASIDIPDSVSTIGDEAFRACSNLISVDLPTCLREVSSRMFGGCERLTSISIPKGVSVIGAYAFQECSRLTSITIPDSVTSIEHHAFERCKALTEVVLPNGLKNISSGLFSCCEKLAYIAIPDSVASIGGMAFENCESLTTIRLPAQLRTIETAAFSGCMQLWHILYTGTEVLWSTVDLQGDAYGLLLPEIHYNYDGSWMPDPQQRICPECCRQGKHYIPQGERVEPTCTEDGLEKGICSYCGEFVEMPLEKTAISIIRIPGYWWKPATDAMFAAMC